jgi:aminoglycoside phosphotransferase (APT) family kinase protein
MPARLYFTIQEHNTMPFDLNAYRPRILKMLSRHAAALPWSGSLETVEMTLLGIGESNLMVHLALDGQQPLTMRLAYREERADHFLQQEFHLLQSLPEGLGPRAFALDLSRQLLPYPCAILSFVPGTPLVEYSEEILHRHAVKLARLHAQESATWTERTGGTSRQVSEPFDISRRFQQGVAYWRARSPQAFEDELVCRLVPRLDAYFCEQTHLFTALTRFPLVHGDLCASNVMVHEGDVCYIDWEYAGYGDAALDFAQLAWDIESPPWQLQLSEQQLARFFQPYLELHPDPTLAERHAVWCVYIKFFDHFGHRLTASQPRAVQSFSSATYQAIYQRQLASLARQFL